MFPLVLTLLAFSPFTVVLSHYGSYGHHSRPHNNHYDHDYDYYGGSSSEESPVSDESSSPDESSPKYFSCPSSSSYTRHYSNYQRPPQRPKPSSSDCSFNEEFPEGTTLNVTCRCPKYSNFEISSDGSTYDNSVKCDGSKYISTQVDSNVFKARETKSGSSHDNNYRPHGYNNYYGRQSRHYYGGSSSYGRPNNNYGSNYGSNGYHGSSRPHGSHEYQGSSRPHGSHGSYESSGHHGSKPSSDSKVECVVTPVTEPTTTAAPTTETPTTAAPTTEAPTTAAPTTEAPTTAASTTEVQTTAAPTTQVTTTADTTIADTTPTDATTTANIPDVPTIPDVNTP